MRSVLNVLTATLRISPPAATQEGNQKASVHFLTFFCIASPQPTRLDPESFCDFRFLQLITAHILSLSSRISGAPAVFF